MDYVEGFPPLQVRSYIAYCCFRFCPSRRAFSGSSLPRHLCFRLGWLEQRRQRDYIQMPWKDENHADVRSAACRGIRTSNGKNLEDPTFCLFVEVLCSMRHAGIVRDSASQHDHRHLDTGQPGQRRQQIGYSIMATWKKE